MNVEQDERRLPFGDEVECFLPSACFRDGEPRTLEHETDVLAEGCVVFHDEDRGEIFRRRHAFDEHCSAKRGFRKPAAYGDRRTAAVVGKDRITACFGNGVRLVASLSEHRSRTTEGDRNYAASSRRYHAPWRRLSCWSRFARVSRDCSVRSARR